ncbi:hypothetical protein RHSIM_Rhsim07G0062600 [Rhododendron simsii]|uniref:Dirigent protein n=1 Tax=Rhododendron simsii TaxID=118357 RepID=A0A834GMN3_RHOSS|nr:hypothetical protein RHSIM_Rhsim07G0062600 [Rhododendron simsii]
MASNSLNFPLFTFFLVTLLTTSVTTTAYGTFSDEVSEAIFLKRIEKTTHLHFYFHDITGPELTSKLVGRAQGMYTLASQKSNPELLMVVTYKFVVGPYNGSSISVLGRNPVMNDVREFPVVGGSGLFRLARGYALAHTVMFDIATGDATVEYNVYVMH